MTATERLLRELIAIPSVNPAFLPGNRKLTGERKVAQWVADFTRKAGLEVKSQAVSPGRANLLARLTPSQRPKHRLLLAPHFDTVGALGENEKLLTPDKHQGKLFGRGACDTKGSVAVMLQALVEVARTGRRPARTEIVFAGLVDEECSQAGSRALVQSKMKADLAVVGEPTQLRVITAHKGVLWLQVETRGKAAHGARPDLGRNAVLRMARVVEALEVDYAKTLRQRSHPLLGCASINVGWIAGGHQPNMVPDRCEIAIDRRTLPGEYDRIVTREVRALLKEKGIPVRIWPTYKRACYPLETSPKLPLVRQLLKVVGQRKPAGVDYFSDAAILAEGGIPSVVFGPGNIAQAHTPEEFVELKQLEQARESLVCFLRGLP